MVLEGLTIEQLTDSCPACNGMGKIPEKVISRGFSTVIEPAHNCPTCWGAGKLPSEAGKVILEFLRIMRLNPNNRP